MSLNPRFVICIYVYMAYLKFNLVFIFVFSSSADVFLWGGSVSLPTCSRVFSLWNNYLVSIKAKEVSSDTFFNILCVPEYQGFFFISIMMAWQWLEVLLLYFLLSLSLLLLLISLSSLSLLMIKIRNKNNSNNSNKSDYNNNHQTDKILLQSQTKLNPNYVV